MDALGGLFGRSWRHRGGVRRRLEASWGLSEASWDLFKYGFIGFVNFLWMLLEMSCTLASLRVSGSSQADFTLASLRVAGSPQAHSTLNNTIGGTAYAGALYTHQDYRWTCDLKPDTAHRAPHMKRQASIGDDYDVRRRLRRRQGRYPVPQGSKGRYPVPRARRADTRAQGSKELLLRLQLYTQQYSTSHNNKQQYYKRYDRGSTRTAGRPGERTPPRRTKLLI